MKRKKKYNKYNAAINPPLRNCISESKHCSERDLEGFESKEYLICWGNLKFSIRDGESTPELLRGNIGAILHSNILLDGSNQAPELFLHQLHGHHLSQTTEG